LRKIIKKVDVIIHLAAETGTGQSMYDIKKYVDVNIGGTANILDILLNEQHCIKKIILASSRAVYGEGKYRCENCGVTYPSARNAIDMTNGVYEPKCNNCQKSITATATDEDSILSPSSIYAITKQVQENLIQVSCHSIKLPFVIFRYQNVYGPGQSLLNPYTGILSIFSNQIRNDNCIEIYEDGKESRDFVFLDDVVEATILGIQSDNADYQILNVGYGEPISVLTVAKLLGKELNVNMNQRIKISGKYRTGDIRHNYADLTKLNSVLGFIPKFNIEKGLEKFISWVVKQPIYRDEYSKSVHKLQSKNLIN